MPAYFDTPVLCRLAPAAYFGTTSDNITHDTNYFRYRFAVGTFGIPVQHFQHQRTCISSDTWRVICYFRTRHSKFSLLNIFTVCIPLVACSPGGQQLFERVAFEGQTVVFQAPKGNQSFFYKNKKKISESRSYSLVLHKVTTSTTARYFCMQGPSSSTVCHLHIVCKFTVNGWLLPLGSLKSSLKKIPCCAQWEAPKPFSSKWWSFQ